MEQNFEDFHRLANDYFYFYFEGKRSFTHKVSNRHFALWIYFNSDNNIDMEKQLKIICDLSKDHNFESSGWNRTPDVVVYKAL